MLEYDADSALIGPEGAGREKGKQKNQSLRRNMSRPRPTAIIESVGNPFDRVWAQPLLVSYNPSSLTLTPGGATHFLRGHRSQGANAPQEHNQTTLPFPTRVLIVFLRPARKKLI